MMQTYILLFRGINVSGTNLVKMKALVAALEDNGYENVKSYIQSGNLIVQAKTKPENIGEIVEREFDFKPQVLVLDKGEFQQLLDNNPYEITDGKLVHAYYCKQPPEPNLDKLEKYKKPSEQYEIKDRVFYLHAPDGIDRSKLVANIEACLGVAATGRNFNTLRKLQEILSSY